MVNTSEFGSGDRSSTLLGAVMKSNKLLVVNREFCVFYPTLDYVVPRENLKQHSKNTW